MPHLCTGSGSELRALCPRLEAWISLLELGKVEALLLADHWEQSYWDPSSREQEMRTLVRSGACAKEGSGDSFHPLSGSCAGSDGREGYVVCIFQKEHSKRSF